MRRIRGRAAGSKFRTNHLAAIRAHAHAVRWRVTGPGPAAQAGLETFMAPAVRAWSCSESVRGPSLVMLRVSPRSESGHAPSQHRRGGAVPWEGLAEDLAPLGPGRTVLAPTRCEPMWGPASSGRRSCRPAALAAPANSVRVPAAPAPALCYCPAVMVDPARAPGRERSSSVPSWHEIVPTGCYNRRDF